ncbi:PorT family protein [Flavobacterium agricola]|uniref:PorT family protein n=1 Tax=Flavobacterium agricola TaxID=2870839 RepID=A0ABY6LZ20_9FLAO|nr:porin family protein [Flavobacterium agricola]UYW01484.1 PorT family protein [Flavobacterium agricola]
MKKRIFVAATCLIFSVSAWAQTSKSEFTIGLKGGYNLSKLSDVSHLSLKNKSLSGFHAGAFVELPITKGISLQPELLYSTQGSRVEATNADGSSVDKYDSRINYITLPVLVKVYLTQRLSVEAGPQFALLTQAHADGNTYKIDDVSENVNINKFKHNIKDQVENFDFDLAVGASYKLPLNLFVSARYVWGVKDIAKNSDSKSKNQLFQLSAGLRF